MQGVAKRRAQRARRARCWRLVGLAEAFDKKPHQLSGGQRQRVALARALVVEPAVLLLDEPLGALDLKLRRQMQDELKAIQKRVGTAFVHVTHDQEEAMALADHCVVMNHGRIEDEGAPGARLCAARHALHRHLHGRKHPHSRRVASGERQLHPARRFGPFIAGCRKARRSRWPSAPSTAHPLRRHDLGSAGRRRRFSGQLQARAGRVRSRCRLRPLSPGFRRTAAVEPGDAVAVCCRSDDLSSC